MGDLFLPTVPFLSGSCFLAATICIGPVQIDTSANPMTVTVDPGVSLNDAAREFFDAVLRLGGANRPDQQAAAALLRGAGWTVTPAHGEMERG